MATFRDILDQLTTAVAVVDAASDHSFRIAYLNQSAQSLLGRSEARTIGMPLTELMRDSHATSAVLQSALDTGQPFTKREVPLYVGERLVRVNYSISPLSETELLVEIERLDRFSRIDRDERHVTLQETMRKLARGLAHEIKNPLGGIRGAAQLLDRQLDSDAREYTAVIMSEADRLRNLVDRILGPNGRLSFAPVNVHHVIERVVKLLDAESPSRITFKRFYDPSPHFSPGAVMIAEDFGPVRVLATESIAGPTVEGACACTGPKDPRRHGQRSLQPPRSLASRSTS